MRFLALAVVVVTGCFQRQLLATSCSVLPPCSSIRPGSIFFVGTVLSSEPVGSPKDQQSYDVHFQVDESFMGISPTTKEVVVTAEGSWLEKGHSYLIEAGEGHDKHLYPKTCGDSGEVTDSDIAPVVKYLRKRAKGKVGTSLTVDVKDRYKPVPDVDVKVDGPSGTLNGRTGADGFVEFKGVKPGEYHATATRGHYRADPESRFRPDVEVVAGSCAGVTIAVKPDSAVGGLVLDVTDVPVPLLPLELVSAPEGPTEAISLNSPLFETKTDSDGHFQFESVSPGRYLLGSNIIGLATSSIPPAFYPGSATRGGAASIEVRLGETVDKLLFTLPDLGRPRDIQICVVDLDGKAMPGVNIASGFDLKNGTKLAGNLTTDGTGCVTPRGYTRAGYSIHAILRPPGADLLHIRISDETLIEPGEQAVHRVLVLKPPLRPAKPQQ